MLFRSRIRKDNDGFYVVVNWEKGIWFIVSESFVDILDLCDGKTSVSEIVIKYSNEYPEVSCGIIMRDVKTVITKSLMTGLISV